MVLVDNPTLTDRRGNVITLYATSIDETITNKVTAITPGQSTSNWDNGPKDTKLLDLLRVEERFTVRAEIHEDDITTFKDMMRFGGIKTMTWDAVVQSADSPWSINIEKATITKKDREDNHRKLMFTCVVGVDL